MINEEKQILIMKNLKYIFNHFGQKNQLLKLREECMELIEEIDNIKDKDGELPIKFLHECADVLVVSNQFYGEHKRELEPIIIYKILRTLNRIEKMFYNKESNA